MSRAGSSGDDMVKMLTRRLDMLDGFSSHRLPTLADGFQDECGDINEALGILSRGEKLIVGLPTGLGIDEVVPGGVPVDKVTTIFGESGNFKTTFKNNLVWGIANSGIGSVLDVSLEDANQLTVQRFIARQTGLSYGRVATRDLSFSDAELVESVAPEALATASRIILGGNLSPNFDDIIRLARHYKRTRGLVAVVIDYLQLLDEDDSNERIALKNILKKAQRAAKRDRIAYIFVSQMSQQDQGKHGPQRPSCDDMFGSSWMKFASKLSMSVYRPWKYEKTPRKPRKPSDPDYTRLVKEHPRGKEIYKMVIEVWLQKNILGESEVMVPCLVQPRTGKMVPMPLEMKEYLI
jgi:replicative DNA helicase